MSRFTKFILALLMSVLPLLSGSAGGYAAESSAAKQRDYVIPCGTPFGIKVKSEGVMVIETAGNSPAEKEGIKPGDVVTSVNGRTVTTNREIACAIQLEESETQIVIKRNSDEIKLSALPENIGGTLKLGMWVRDSAAGIGTLTFYDPDSGGFGGLGHAVNDVTTGETVPLRIGEITDAEIYDVVKGKEGCAGELCGTITANSDIGTLSENTEAGVFGKLDEPVNGKAIPVAYRQEIHTGPAKILATIDENGAQEYDIEILRMNFFDPEGSKGMLIRITDSKLLEKTGGIVKGMSGSPIIQDGMLAGAVTHVLVNDPSCGYAIPAESMMKHIS